MYEDKQDSTPTYETQVRQERLLLLRLSLRQGFMPSRDQLRMAMTHKEWKDYIAGLAVESKKGQAAGSSDPRLRVYWQWLSEADKLQRRVARTSQKRRDASWQRLRDQTREAYSKAFGEIWRVAKNSPELQKYLWPAPVWLQHPLWPQASDMPRLRGGPMNRKSWLYSSEPKIFTKVYVESLIETDPGDDHVEE